MLVYAKKVRDHWKWSDPALYRALKKSGKLKEESEEVAKMALEELRKLCKEGVQIAAAREIVEKEYIYPPPI